jgi:transcriptional regulator
VHPNPAFRWDDREALVAFAEAVGFGTLFAQTPDGPRAAHIPFIWTGDSRIAFHIARGNGIARHLDGATALLVVNGPDGYVSPDWYGTDNQVPTWNYVAAEFEGPVALRDEAALLAQIDALSAQHEATLAPKAPWTRDKVDPAAVSKMLSAIRCFEMRVTAWRGTAKLGQNKSDEVRLRTADALDAVGNRALAHLMRSLPR